MAKGTLLTVHGKTDGSSTTGDFDLNCEWFESAVDYIRLDKGIVAKIWSIEASMNPVTVVVKYTHDVTQSTPTWVELKRVHLASEGDISHDKRKPLLVISGKSGKEAVRFSWVQTTAAESHITVTIEFTQIEYTK